MGFRIQETLFVKFLINGKKSLLKPPEIGTLAHKKTRIQHAGFRGPLVGMTRFERATTRPPDVYSTT